MYVLILEHHSIFLVVAVSQCHQSSGVNGLYISYQMGNREQAYCKPTLIVRGVLVSHVIDRLIVLLPEKQFEMPFMAILLNFEMKLLSFIIFRSCLSSCLFNFINLSLKYISFEK